MAYRIFLSHNYKDKPLVETVALKLAGIFGRDQVFMTLGRFVQGTASLIR